MSILLAIGSAWAETGGSDWFYRAWQTEDGLPDNTVSGLAQTPDGYLWVGTNGGAMRFNGREFSPIPLHNVPRLPSRQIRSMIVDRKGSLWLALERGPVIRIGESSFRAFDRDDHGFEGVARFMVEDPQGRLWVGFSHQVFMIEGDRVSKPESIPSGINSGITCDQEGQVWLAKGGQLGRLNPEGFEPIRNFGEVGLSITPSIDSGLWIVAGSELLHMGPDEEFQSVTTLPANITINTLFADQERSVWIGTQLSGLIRVSDGRWERVPTSHPWVQCITEDRNGYIWAGTIGGGLNLIKRRTVSLQNKSNGFPFSTVRSTSTGPDGRIWAVSQGGRLAFRESGEWQRFQTKSGNERFNCVLAHANGRTWLGTQEHGLLRIHENSIKRFVRADGLASLFVRSVFAAKNGDLWIATDNPFRLHRLRDGKITALRDGGKFKAIRAFAEGADGTIWAGTSDGHLFRVGGDQLIKEEGAEEMPSIRTLQTTPDGSLWIGYAGEGLGHLKDGRYTRFTTEEGLYDDYISQIQDDGQGSLWIASNRGLFHVGLDDLLNHSPASRTKLRCRVFGRSDGLPSFQPSRDYCPSSSRGPDNQLYFATSNGLIEAHPHLTRQDSQSPPVVLEKVTVNNELAALYQARSMLMPGADKQTIDLSKDDPAITIPPDHDKITITFSALGLASPENTGVRYRLSPLDSNWEESDSQHSTTFTRLPAGKYKFQVTACNSRGVWNEVGASLDIIVEPFFWETWWFRIGGGLFTALAAGGIVFLGLRRKHHSQLRKMAAKRALEMERSRIARDIHDDLGASLTRISLLSQSSSVTPSESVLSQIQSTARHLMRSMDEVVWAIDPEHDSFDDLVNYISSYAQEFLSVANIRCRLEVPIAVPERPLSSQLRHNLFLAFKEALNNVVKYANASEVRITLEAEDDRFSLRVEDDGQGIDPNAPADPSRSNSGSGLNNMTNRMDEIGGTCIVESSPDRGTSVEFSVPF
ncbi:sensor histidine kinase [Haloferula rosea]|uniref:ATP-binding protein n=1 Tax=Haloferula rosea TaxID=490093 RepID=A0A934R749_9BACT|nr:sensor histidine kinase [Haloferula rosea]MBK1825457.1 ATP-binding protein [Haloferula rosea]